jgi:hypothetical protein
MSRVYRAMAKSGIVERFCANLSRNPMSRLAV